MLRDYFLRTACVQELCRRAGISISTLYRWRALFLTHKALWLGILEDMNTTEGTFLSGIDGSFLQEFFHRFLFSFLQPLRGTSPDLPYRPPEQFPAST